MTTQRRLQGQWLTDRKLIQDAAAKVRSEANMQQTENLLGREPIVELAAMPELSYSAAVGDLRGELRHVTLRLAQAVLDSGEPLTEPDSRPPD